MGAGRRRGLGDLVETALKSVGITEDEVKKWIPNCGCAKRKRWLNRLTDWANRALSGKMSGEEAVNDLERTVGKKLEKEKPSADSQESTGPPT